MEIENKMHEIWAKAEIKGLSHWEVYKILHKNGWEAYLHNPIPGQEWGNKERKRINAEAIEQTLLELDYLI